jgi:heme exporter protein C
MTQTTSSPSRSLAVPVSASQMQAPSRGLAVLAAATAILFALTLYWVFFVAPIELQMGIVQQIFYFHVPSAYSMYVALSLCVVGSAVYLWKRSEAWEAVAVAGAEVGVMFCLIVIVTGPIWAYRAWGTLWTWDPRLTTTLLVMMIYVAYLLLRNLGTTGEAEQRFAAGLGLIGGFLMPIVHYSVELWRGQHPTVITRTGGGLHPEMRTALLLGFAAFTALTALLVWVRARLERERQRLVGLELTAAENGMLEEQG